MPVLTKKTSRKIIFQINEEWECQVERKHPEDIPDYCPIHPNEKVYHVSYITTKGTYEGAECEMGCVIRERKMVA